MYILLVLLLGTVLTCGIGYLNAGLVRIRRAEVVLPDLPEGFDGATLLYASDIDLCGTNTPEKSGVLFNQLQSLKPDILLLGGDYTSTSLLERLNRTDGDVDTDKILRQRSSFFHYIESFNAPLGKYAIASPEDPLWDELRATLEQAGVQPLINARTEVRAGNERLWLAGICEESANLNAAGRSFEQGECVVVVAYSPCVMPILLTSEAIDGGQWADLALCGNTHGGQIQLFGQSVLSLTEAERRFLSGWNTESGLPLLTSSGVGCEGLNLRLGTSPEVWLITLKAA